ncbi:(d)CMP kinase [Fervidibacillus albus]|uniref:Cytidylate kinase n=1 Tax=Fervidibacillus albus TaxID=2980026 RepID=A0A9E8RW08_9BACI|nr:(d)CMP kinase [Fervidibacillus albus]WAA11235.1 (d)CMP kinase [Fervidibacillus albus]
MEKRISIAIDGPAAAGKSTVAKILAQKLSYLYIDTGAMYRALTWKALQNGIDPEDEEALDRLLTETSIELKQRNGNQRVFVDGQDVTDAIRLPEVTNAVSNVSKHERVRTEMVLRQQQFAKHGGVVMDGRDIGTHVLPEAEVKFFLRAGVEERAKRRHLENVKKGIPSDYDQLVTEIAKRDELDSNRKIAPLKKAQDAIEIDTTALSIDQVVEKMMKYVTERI